MSLCRCFFQKETVANCNSIYIKILKINPLDKPTAKLFLHLQVLKPWWSSCQTCAACLALYCVCGLHNATTCPHFLCSVFMQTITVWHTFHIACMSHIHFNQHNWLPNVSASCPRWHITWCNHHNKDTCLDTIISHAVITASPNMVHLKLWWWHTASLDMIHLKQSGWHTASPNMIHLKLWWWHTASPNMIHLKQSGWHKGSLDTIPSPNTAIIADGHQNVPILGDSSLPDGCVTLLVSQLCESRQKEWHSSETADHISYPITGKRINIASSPVVPTQLYFTYNKMFHKNMDQIYKCYKTATVTGLECIIQNNWQ